LTRKLSLGPVPNAETTRLTIAVSAQLRADLDRYAALHTELHGTAVDAATLAPLMLEAFIARDKGFRAGRARPSGDRPHPVDEQSK
jgi:hypothetical protein